jgi:hypothetical protein
MQAKDLYTKTQIIAGPGQGDEQKPKGPWMLANRIGKMLALAPAAGDHNVALTFGQIHLLYVLLQLEGMMVGAVASLSPALARFMVAAAGRPRIASS